FLDSPQSGNCKTNNERLPAGGPGLYGPGLRAKPSRHPNQPAAHSRSAESPPPVVFSSPFLFERRQPPTPLEVIVLVSRELHEQRPLDRIQPQHHLAQFRFVERSAASSVRIRPGPDVQKDARAATLCRG